MDKLKMHSLDGMERNIERIGKLFPNAITEVIRGGKVEHAIDFDVLRQELSDSIVEGREERYQFTWPDKKKAMLAANAPITATMRPVVADSVGRDGTPGGFDSENLYIEGDNLEVLKLLQETYLGKVKMIYIDPPYNTGNDFVYVDDFAQSADEYMGNSGQYDEEGNRLVTNTESNGRFHTDWLNMIYTRLKLAKDILSDDGVIFISIDDNEVDNLRKCCDEIYGNQNFIAHIIHKNNSMKNQSKYVGISTEFVLIYAKDITVLNEKQGSWRTKKKGAADINATFNKLKDKGLPLDIIREEIMEMYSRPKYAHLSRWNKVDDKGVFKDADLSRSNGPKNYTIINPHTGKECPIPNRGWGKSYEELLRLQKEDLIWYGDENTAPGMKSYLTEDSESVFDNFVFADTASDKKMIDKMFGRAVFEFPKSMEMMKQLISLCAKESDVILDFFSGSATTAHAVMKLNAEDGGHRKFILVQLPEKTDEKSEAYKAGYKNICEIGKERIRRAGKKIKEDAGLTAPADLDIGFRCLRLDESNMKAVYYRPDEVDQQDLFSLVDNVKSDRTPEDLLFQVMLDLGVLLSSSIETKEIADKKVFNVADGFLLACFDHDVTEETVKAIAQMKPYYAVFRDSSMANDSVATNFEQIFETYSSDTVRKVL